MYWDRLERQVRSEGRVEPVPEEVADAYFVTRSREHQIGAWASDQSERLESWEILLGRIAQVAKRFGNGSISRPSNWGGHALLPDRMEFCREVPVGCINRCRTRAVAIQGTPDRRSGSIREAVGRWIDRSRQTPNVHTCFPRSGIPLT